MRLRWLIHRVDGSTVVSGWNSPEVSFRKNWSKDITSLQIQTDNGKFYTLSKGQKRNAIFWQEDDYIVQVGSKNPEMIARKILKSIGDNIWLALKVGVNGIPSLDIIRKRIEIK